MDGTLGPEPWTVDGESLDAKTQGVAGRETSHNEKKETSHSGKRESRHSGKRESRHSGRG